MRSILSSITLSVFVFASCLQSAHAVNIAIVDTGLNSNVLGGVLEPEGFDFVNNDNDPSDNSTKTHGTAAGHVAINSGTGITLTAIKTSENADTSDLEINRAAFDYIATLDSVQVVSHDGASISDTPLESLQAVTNAGKIIVLQAGNFGLASPSGDAAKASQLGGRAIVAGGVTADGTDIQVFSNRAGSQKEHFLMANTRSLITSSNGTSMATPRIAAAAATVLGKFSFLAPEQVVQILFNTATDLGSPGVDAVYGNGVLDLDAALSAAGAGAIPDPNTDGGGGGGGGIGIAALVIAGGVAFTMMNDKEELQRTILVDEFGRAFRFDFANRIKVRDPKPDIFSLMDKQRADFELVPLARTSTSYTQAMIANQTIDPFSFTASDTQRDTRISFLHRAQDPESSYSMAMNTDLSSDFGALSIHNQDKVRAYSKFARNDLFTTPVLGYSSQGSAFTYGWNNENVNHRFGLSVVDEQEKNGQVSNSILYESQVSEDEYHVGFQLGALVENGSLLGGASDSALGVDQTSTYYLGVNGSYNLTENVSLLGGYFQGISSVEESKNSLLSNFSGIRTEGYALGLLVDNLFSTNGRFGLSFSNPLQTIDGSATLTLPVSQNMNTGAIGFESSSLSFSNVEKEKVLEAYYNYQLNPKSTLFTHISFTENPVSNLDASQDSTVYFGWKRSF